MNNAARGWRDPQVRRAATILLILTLGASPAAWAEKAYFAGGCFWCMESDFEGLPGVEDVISGFTGGTAKSPTYNGDHTGHYEAIKGDESYHQDYYKKSPLRYRFYRFNCGRDARLKKIWGDRATH